MLEWIRQNYEIVQVAVGVVTVFVWVAYLQLLLISFRRQRRPMILINCGAGEGVRARCFISNLGMEPVYLLDVTIRVETCEGFETAAITDRNPELEGEVSRPADATHQGPLETGNILDIGSFETLVERAIGDEEGVHWEDVVRLELTAIIATAADNRLGGARRSFAIEEGDPYRLVAESLTASQIRSRADRRRITRWLEERRRGVARYSE
ncbi:hypothetical protein [Tranquillimonas alkanivorans]|uniref:Uncharacterized protein n=1 Tax=Tranquillimonas alkanivorans TaxID=441119 RepID=A0A1I5TEF7_9RHOB|nr:hypothetical protein [Tranquillimonas alkanivorans]SFP81338.1 hypothetical protein SAMN04488047_11377 [Tranquillimonas alkanivorans]